ncbi:ankyrin repeat-containing domain protein [Tricladium varicosporioides]|nr:ankyrin repeat-containing domain protein [Hymenoscyphus varicosporioides]
MSSQDSQDFVILEETDIRDYNEAGLLPQTPEVIAEIQTWLQPTDFYGDGSEYTKHLNSYVEGTDLWIQDTDAYRKWHDSADHGSLWIKAIAGAGKSVFAAMMAAKLARSEKVPVLFFFFRQIVDTNHDPHSLARDWISMTLPHSPPLQAKMKGYIDNRRTLDNVSTNEFWGDLIQSIALLPKVYCIVDALDEMDIDQEDFFQHLVLLGEQKPSSIKVLMTSRPLPRIGAYLKTPSVLQIKLEQLKVDKDISLYVDYRLDKLPELDSDLKLGIKGSIGEKARGSFLYARLMMDELLDHMKAMVPKIEFFQRSLDWLPLTLEDMYNGMLADHSLRSRVPQELQLTILQWVTHSSRPLRLLELAAMLDSLNGAHNAGKDTKAVVRTACGPLLEILDDETVSVIHHSFTEFLVDAGRASRQSESRTHPQFPVIHPPNTHNSMAFTCLKYLTSGHTDEWEVKERRSDDDFFNPRKLSQKEIKMRHPFLDYAMHNWYVHTCKLGLIEGGLLDILDDFMTPENPAFVTWLDMAWPSHRNLKQTSALHVASWAGMTSYVQNLLERGVECNARDGAEMTPLSRAASKGNTEIVALLLKYVTDPDVDDYNGLKPLHHAASANHHTIVRLLLDAGVSPLTGKARDPGRRCGNAPSTIGHSPLMYASQSGCTESVREMIPFLKTEDITNALRWAARSGRSQVVDLLLALPDISVDPPGRRDSPLFLAAAGLHLEIMKSLLAKGADPNRKNENVDEGRGMHCFVPYDLLENRDNLGATALHAVCGINRHSQYRQSTDDNMKECFYLLLEAGCDIDAMDMSHRTPLHITVSQERFTSKANDTLAILLINNGANVMALDKTGNTPLHLVKPSPNSAPIIELLIARGANLSVRRPSDGRTPLHTMMDCIHTLDIKFLVPYVADWNIKDSKGDTPLHILLSTSYHPDAVTSDLLQAGADLNIKNKKGEAPIHVLREIGRSSFGSDVLPTLQKVGADLETKDSDGRTVLLRLLRGFDAIKCFKHLAGLGANIHARDHKGNSALHIVCMQSIDDQIVGYSVFNTSHLLCTPPSHALHLP